MEVDMKYIHRQPHASWINRRQNLSNKSLPQKSNKILPAWSNKILHPSTIKKWWDLYAIFVIWTVITILCVISVVDML